MASPFIHDQGDAELFRALDLLLIGVRRGPAFDMRNAETAAALACLDACLPWPLPMRQFRMALELSEKTARNRQCAEALDNIMLAVAAWQMGAD